MNICHQCIEFLRLGKLPKLSIANEFDFGSVPSWLPVLTIVEECLIVLCRARFYILKLSSHSVGPPSTAQSALKGHCICFTQDTEKIFNALPHSTADLGDVLQIVFLSVNTSASAIHERMKRCKILTVQRGAVKVWLEFLCQNNHYYTNVKINDRYTICLFFSVFILTHFKYSNLAQLPEERVPTELLEQITITSDKTILEADTAQQTGYTESQHYISRKCYFYCIFESI